MTARSRSSNTAETSGRGRQSGVVFDSTVLPGLALPWDFGVLDRLQAPLTHYHE